MFSKSRIFLVAILLASSAASAAAAPLSAAQSDGVQAFISAIRAELKAQGVSDGDAIVDKTEAHLKDVGFINDETVSDLNDEIKFMTSKGGLSIDEIAELFVDDLRSVDAIRKRDQLGIAKDTLIIDPDLVKRVMRRSPCPPGGNTQSICCPQ